MLALAARDLIGVAPSAFWRVSAEPAADLDDLRDRAVAILLGLPMPGVPDPGHPFVLVAADLAPADTATLDPETVVAIVTERGGPGGDADVWVMAPMVATAEEARAFADAARGQGLNRVGVMIEVPSAALTAHEVLDAVDLASIGTNDLSQYTFAADRLAGELSELLDTWQPALLRLVAAVATAGSELERPVGVCGEAVSDPLMALVLARLG